MARPHWHDEHQRLKVALRKTRAAYDSDSSGRDIDVGTDIANIWMYIASCYSGVEQSLKVIYAEHRGRSIAEMRNEIRRGRGHDLALLFNGLDHGAKCILARYYARFQSLHDYIPIVSLPEFLQSISRTDGKGYERWRYALIETDVKLPTNSSEAMFAIWTSSVQLIGARLGLGHMTLPDQALAGWLQRLLLRVPDTIDPIWKECYCQPINHAARLLWEDYRGIEAKQPWIDTIK